MIVRTIIRKLKKPRMSAPVSSPIKASRKKPHVEMGIAMMIARIMVARGFWLIVAFSDV